MRHRTFVLASLLTGFLAAAAFAQPKGPATDNAAKRVAQQQRREWVRTQIHKLVSDEAERAAILGRLNDLSDDQVQELATICLDELEARRKQQFAELREANARERSFQEQLARQISQPAESAASPFPAPAFAVPPYAPGFPVPAYAVPQYAPYAVPPYAWGPYRGPAVGYFPVITWLPEGTSLSAQAVVSPDRRHVRMSVLPFFSTIGPVHTFNFMTGETRRYDR
jgi:hypothetical protein